MLAQNDHICELSIITVPIFKDEETSSETLSNMLKITQLAKGRARIVNTGDLELLCAVMIFYNALCHFSLGKGYTL